MRIYGDIDPVIMASPRILLNFLLLWISYVVSGDDHRPSVGGGCHICNVHTCTASSYRSPWIIYEYKCLSAVCETIIMQFRYIFVGISSQQQWLSNPVSSNRLTMMPGLLQTCCTNPTMHQCHIPLCTIFVTDVHVCAHFWFKMVRCGMFVWCIVGLVRWVIAVIVVVLTQYHVMVYKWLSTRLW